MNPIIVIPSRLGSTRLPGKALKYIHGDPMIVHVWRRGLEADLGRVIVAAGDQEIVDVIRSHGGEAVLTDPMLPSGSDRAKAALTLADLPEEHDVIVVLQGDLPIIEPSAIRGTLTPLLKSPECDIGTLATKIENTEEIRSNSVVKIALSKAPGELIGRAVYFSRSSIPSGVGAYFHHIGIYAYRKKTLDKFVDLPVGHLERRERLEQLRALENGMRIDASIVDTEPLGVDTAEDLEMAIEILKS